MEWSEQNKYNSFSSYKGLTYYEHYKKIVGWLDGQNALPAPIEASLDPINACNHQCYYCNSQRYLREHPAGLQQWDRDFIKNTLDCLSGWGVKAFCWGGGGEAMLNKNLKGMTEYGVSLGMEASIITNGVYMTDELQLCRWVGVSLDSADPLAYKQVRGTDDCMAVLKNIKRLAQSKTTDVSVKVLVLPETLDSLVWTCEIAKAIGVKDFHVRPVDLERKDSHLKKLELDMDKVQEAFAQCHEMETDDFRVFTVTHKYDGNFHVKHNFKRCLASPLVTQICTDGKMYACVDHRMEPRFEVKGWGTDEHRKLLEGINPQKECSRCTWAEYNRQCEETVINDNLCRNFP